MASAFQNFANALITQPPWIEDMQRFKYHSEASKSRLPFLSTFAIVLRYSDVLHNARREGGFFEQCLTKLVPAYLTQNEGHIVDDYSFALRDKYLARRAPGPATTQDRLVCLESGKLLCDIKSKHLWDVFHDYLGATVRTLS